MSKITEIADHDGKAKVATKLCLAAMLLAKELQEYMDMGENATQVELERHYITVEEDLAEVEILSKEAMYILGYDRNIYDHIKEEKLNKDLARIAKEKKGATKFREFECPYDKAVMCDMTSPCESCVMSKGPIRV